MYSNSEGDGVMTVQNGRPLPSDEEEVETAPKTTKVQTICRRDRNKRFLERLVCRARAAMLKDAERAIGSSIVRFE